MKQKKNVPNLKIPKTLIEKLDRLFRTALLMQQQAGLGIRTEKTTDMEAAIEKAIIGS